jgi:hypothetical protein
MNDSDGLDFKPRARGLVIGGIPWLARIGDKARAHLAGRIGDYIYPCPADQAFLDEHGLTAAEFTAMVAASPDDEALIARVQAHLAARVS